MLGGYGRLVEVLPGLLCVPSRSLDSNVYIVRGDDGLLVVDTGLGLSVEQVFAEMRRAGLDPGEVRLVVNTHCHLDHVGGNDAFLRASPRARVAVHEADAEFLVRGVAEAVEPLGVGRSLVKPTRVDVRLRDGSRVGVGDFEFTVIHTPGHTPGSICLYDEERRVLISGDTVFLEGIGRYDFPYSSYEDLVRSLERLAGLDVEALLPGHGPFSRRDGSRYIRSILSGGYLDGPG